MAREGPTLNDLREALGRRQFAPVYLLHGEEDLLAEQAADLIMESALRADERGFNLDIMYGMDADARDIVSHASSFPMMAERRVVVVRGVEHVANPEILSAYIEHPSETTSLVLQAGKVDMRRKPFTLVKRHGMSIEFRRLPDYQVAAWIVKYVTSQKRTIDADAARLLTVYVGTSLREIRSEIEKLLLYIGDRTVIRVEDVQAAAGLSREYNIFELQKAIGSRDGGRAVMIIDRMLDAGEPAIKTLVMLTRYFSTLWSILDLRARGVPPDKQTAETRLQAFQFKEYTEAATHHTIQDVENAILALAEADEQLKSSGPEPGIVMESLIVRLTDRTAVPIP